MFRTTVKSTSRLRVFDWIPKMLFFWSREPVIKLATGPRAGPWFAWFATAVLIWRCRRRIAKAVFGAGSKLRLLKRRRPVANSLVVSKAHHHHRDHHHHHQQQLQKYNQLGRRTTLPHTTPLVTADHRRLYHQHLKYQQSGNGPSQQQKPQALLRRDVNGVKSRFRRMHPGDGTHVLAGGGRKLAVSTSCVQISQQLYYRVTRSGRVYGKYPHEPQPVK